MIERIDDVPAGVIGIRASGKLTKDDYESVLEPALKEAVDSGEPGVDWIAKSIRLFAWAIPGEVKVFEMDGLDEAKDWVAA